MLASSVQERLRLKRTTLDTWSLREKLGLAEAVARSGDQNWSCVSRMIKHFAEPNRPADWFSAKNCAQQYASLLEQVETPKRKKRSAGSSEKTEVETPGEYIVNKLMAEAATELHRRMKETQALYLTKLDELNELCDPDCKQERINEWLNELKEDESRKSQEVENHRKWLKDREERKLELERAWKPHLPLLRRPSSLSEASSEADSPLSEPLNVDVPEEVTTTKPTPTSPLLTSLLKSPATVNPSSSSILHSAITSPLRGVSPTIASLLNSSSVNLSGSLSTPPANVSSNLKNLVSSALGSFADEQKPTQLSPSQGAPTLSMLLELPPSLPGKPLPMLQTQPPAPPPYTEHLGPPPPYSLATEYLQKQRAVQAAQAQLAATSPTKQQVVTEEEVVSSTTSLIDPIPVPEISPVPEESDLEDDNQDQKQKPQNLIGSNNEYLNMLLQQSDETLEEIVQQEVVGEEALVEELKEVEEAEDDDDDDEEAVPEVDVKSEKEEETSSGNQADLDVFKFVDEVEVGDLNDAKLNYIKNNAQRQAKKEAEAQNQKAMKLLSPRKSTDVVEEAIAPALAEAEEATPTTEVPAVQDEAPSIKEAVEEENKNVESVSMEVDVTHAVINEEKETNPEEPVQVKEEAVDDEPPVESLKDEPKPLELEEPKEFKADEIPLAVSLVEPVEQGMQSKASIDTEDEKSNEAIPKVAKKRRRGTLTVSISDSLPTSPATIMSDDDQETSRIMNKSMLMQLVTSLAELKSSSLFSKPISPEQAPDYSSIVKKPLDLSTIKRQVDCGLIKTAVEIERNVLLMCFNAIMYNGSTSEISRLAVDMAQESMEQIKIIVQATRDNQPSRRETRTADREKRGIRSDGKRSSIDHLRKKMKMDES